MSRKRCGRIGVAAVVAASIGGPAALPAAAQTYRASMDPNEVTYPGTSSIRYRLDVSNDAAAPQRLSIELQVPLYGDPGEDGHRREGSLLGPPTSLTTEGSISIDGRATLSAIPACSPSINRYHGYEPTGELLTVSMPPFASGAISVTYPTGAHPPWPGADYRLAFAVRRLPPVAGGPADEEPEVVVPDAPRVSARRVGARITFRTIPSSSPTPGLTDQREVQLGRQINIFGRIDPATPGETVTLRYLGPQNRGRFRTLARVRVDRRGGRFAGRFRYRGWRPKQPGHYELWAFYRSSRRDIVDDYACPRGFTVK